jgi:prophage regulatory protein
MRIITWKELRLIVPYSRQHVARLEKEGKFPKRVRLGDSPRGRIGWLEGEILEWLQRRIHLRDEPVAEAAE